MPGEFGPPFFQRAGRWAEPTAAFIGRSADHVVGWVSFYGGKTAEENERKGDAAGKLAAAWLRRFGEMAEKRKGLAQSQRCPEHGPSIRL